LHVFNLNPIRVLVDPAPILFNNHKTESLEKFIEDKQSNPNIIIATFYPFTGNLAAFCGNE